MVGKLKVLWLVLGGALLCTLVWVSLKNPQTMGGHRGSAIVQLSEALPENLSALGKLVAANYREYRANAVRWSAVYFGCLFGAAFLSAGAGVLLKLESLNGCPRFRKDTAAVMAALASLLITLLTIGSFEEKWRANRIAAGAMENLAYDLLKSDASQATDEILARIQEINQARNSGIVGAAALVGAEAIGDKSLKVAPTASTDKAASPGDGL